MSEDLEQLESFFERWRGALTDGAEIRFEAQLLDNPPLLHTAVADDFVRSLGLRPIGQNWEMLDADAAPDAARSALAALQDALSHDMALPKQAWLGVERAAQCGSEFLACFDPSARTVLTNRMDFGWNPVTNAAIEWAFVGFDDRRIALLLLTAES